MVVYSDHGAYEVEHDNQTPYQWTGPSVEIDVHNFGRTVIDGVRVTFSLAAPDSAPRRFTVHPANGSTQEVDVDGRETQQVQVVLSAAPGRNSVIINTTGASATIGKAGPQTNPPSKTAYGKIIDLRASAADPKVRIGVLQQRVG